MSIHNKPAERRSRRWLERGVFLSGTFLAALGVTVVLACAIHADTVLQIHLEFPRAQPNDAFSLLICGIGLCAFQLNRLRLVQRCGQLVILMGMIPLIWYLCRIDLGILRRLTTAFPSATDLLSGQMSPVIALCFILAGFALLFMAKPGPLKERPIILSFIGSIIGTIGAVGLFGYATGLRGAYESGSLMQVSLLSAAAFIVLGTALLAVSWREAKIERSGIPQWPTAVVAVVTGALCLWHTLRIAQHTDIQRNIKLEVMSVSFQVLHHMHARFLTLLHIADRWKEGGEFNRKQWEHDTLLELKDTFGFHAIAWVDAHSRVRWVVPVTADTAPFERILNQNVQRPSLHASSALALLSLPPPPDSLDSPATGFLAYTPLKSERQFDGFIVGLFNTKNFFDGVLAGISKGVSIEVRAEDQPVYARIIGGRHPEATWSQEQSVTLPGLTWRLRVWPTPSQLAAWNSPLPAVMLVGGWLIAGLLGLACYLAQTSIQRARKLLRSNRRLAVEVGERKLAELALARAHIQLEHKVAERTAQLRQSEMHFRLMADAAPVLIWLTGPDNRFTYFNKGWLEFTGRSMEQEVGHGWIDGIHPDDVERCRDTLFKSFERREPFCMEYRLRRADGEHRWVFDNGLPLFDAGAGRPFRGYIGSCIDITEQKRVEESLTVVRNELERRVEERTAALQNANADLRLEVADRQRAEVALLKLHQELERSHEELQTAHVRLMQAAKMDSVGQLAAGVAHEVKNPLGVLLMGVEHLSEHYSGKNGKNRELAEMLHDMREAVQRANAAIRGLLDFSAPTQLEWKFEVINDLIKEALALVKHDLVKGHVKAVPLLSRALPQLKLDHNKMMQVFVNLFMNAVQAMPAGGTLTVRTFLKKLGEFSQRHAEPPSSPDSVLNQTLVVVEIDDTGSGVSKEKLARIFEPFFTTKANTRGTGLGLTVTREIVHLHGGAITIKNRPEGGVRVTLMFEVAAFSDQREAGKPSAPALQATLVGEEAADVS